MAEAAERCPDLLYSKESPFFPILDVVPYASDPAVALVITPTPPVPFSAQLDYNSVYTGDELRRVLERARDIFYILTALERRGISLDGLRPSDGWRKSITYSTIGPWFLPSYARPSSTKGRKGTRFTRVGSVEVDFPSAPPDAWPVPVYSANGDIVPAIPWSPLAAFHDPRVRGPTTYLHGLDESSWTDEGAEEKRRENQAAAPKNDDDFRLDVKPLHRFHADTLMMTEVVVEDFTRGWGMTQEEVVEVLESSQPTEAYLATLATPVEKLPQASDHPRSPLFSFCWVCLFKGDTAYQAEDEDRSRAYDGKCPGCRAPFMMSALPEPVRLLLLRIIKPPTGDSGQPIIVTAQEGYDVFNGVLERLRPERPKDLSLATIMKDEGYHRLLFFEHLRGRFLDDEPLLAETKLYTMKYLIRDQLTPTQKRKVEELRAICGSLESAPQPSAVSSSGKRAAESDDEKEAESEKKAKVTEEQKGQVGEASEDMNVDHADE